MSIIITKGEYECVLQNRVPKKLMYNQYNENVLYTSTTHIMNIRIMSKYTKLENGW